MDSFMTMEGDQMRGEGRRYMFALELKAGTEGKTEYKWTPEIAMADKEEGEMGDSDNLRHTLLLRRVILGPSAKEGETNLITVEVVDPDVKEPVKFPLVYLAKGKEAQSKLDLTFPESHDLAVTFRLAEGAGPVHLIGYHFVERLSGDEDEFNGEAEEMDEEDEEADPEKVAAVVEKVKEVMRAKRRMNENGNGDSAPKKVKIQGTNGSAAKDDEEMEEKEPEPKAQLTSTDK